MKFEYAISDGEGTLIEHGLANRAKIIDRQVFAEAMSFTMIFCRADEECVTGQ